MEQIEALGRRFDEQDAELQDLRRQVAAAPAASGRRLLKGGKKAKTDNANGPGASLGLNAEELVLIRDFLENGSNCSCVGVTGPAGPQGIPGTNGTDGAAGAAGPPGADGADGADGQDGTDVDPKIEALANCMTSSSDDEVIIQGCDFIVRGNGDATYVDPIPAEAKGNLIVGWNEGDGGDKTGLNNLVVGSEHTYTSIGGAVFGQKNTISAASATVTGGYQNTASGVVASVTGGQSNTASNTYASVSGGSFNTAISIGASVSAGYSNEASGLYASVSGGEFNTAIGESGSVSGGFANAAIGKLSSVTGGQNNVASNDSSSVSGGDTNTASGVSASVTGGSSNVASGTDQNVP